MLEGDACNVGKVFEHPEEPVLMKNLVELSRVAQIYDSFSLPASQRTICERLLSPREWFRTPRQDSDLLKLQVLVSHKLGEYLPKEDQLLDWGDPEQIGHTQLLCEYNSRRRRSRGTSLLMNHRCC